MQSHQEQAQSKSQRKTICRNNHGPEKQRVPGIEVKAQTSQGKMRDGCDRRKTRGPVPGQAPRVPGGRGRASAQCRPRTLQTPDPQQMKATAETPARRARMGLQTPAPTRLVQHLRQGWAVNRPSCVEMNPTAQQGQSNGNTGQRDCRKAVKNAADGAPRTAGPQGHPARGTPGPAAPRPM